MQHISSFAFALFCFAFNSFAWRQKGVTNVQISPVEPLTIAKQPHQMPHITSSVESFVVEHAFRFKRERFAIISCLQSFGWHIRVWQCGGSGERSWDNVCGRHIYRLRNHAVTHAPTQSINISKTATANRESISMCRDRRQKLSALREKRQLPVAVTGC